MIKANVTTKDLEGWDAQLDEVMEAIDANLNEVAKVVLTAAKTTSAFSDKTGLLRSKISKKKSKFENGGYIIEAKAPHAHLVEYGHMLVFFGRVTGKRVPAHPFMRPAKEIGLRRAIELFRQR